MPPLARKTTPKARKTAAPKVAPVEPEALDELPDDQQDQEEKDQQEEAAQGDQQFNTAIIPFHGRDIEVNIPTPSQLIIFQRLADQYSPEKVNRSILTVEDAFRAGNRALSAVLSMIVKREDKEFVEDLVLNREIELEDATEIITAALPALQETNPGMSNRKDRRTANKARRVSK